MEQATLIADVLVGAGEQVAQALRCLRSGAELAPHLVEIHRLENEGDRLSRDAVASLFANGIDPMVVIRWKDIFETLEQSVDACEKVAHVLEGISLEAARQAPVGETASHGRVEIERKLLVDELPAISTAWSSRRLEQGYLAITDDAEVRIRRADGTRRG